MKKAKVIAIDGPSGSGKSTIAKMLASKLHLTYLDTGAMFRALAYIMKTLPIDFDKSELTGEEENIVADFLAQIKFEYGVSPAILIRIDGEDLTQKIREHHISAMASKISKFPVVRNYLKIKQREYASTHPAVLEGRDIGTVIFPDAAIKFFLTASSDERAKRRFEELRARDPKGEYKFEQIKEDIENRDIQDTRREIAPLKMAIDAIAIDTTALSIDEVCSEMEKEYKKNVQLFNEGFL